jgi:transposase
MWLLLKNKNMSKVTWQKGKSKKTNLAKSKTPKPSVVQMQVVRPNAAGIDIGDTIHAVAVPPDRDKEPVRQFGAFSCDLQAIVKWLKVCGITSVAMESTGVYWKPLYGILIMNGFEVFLVNARDTKNVSGRKTDMSDAAWIQMLHSCGLLRSSFLPDDLTETLRTLVRQRKALLQDSNRCIQRIQKNFELMNIKIHTVIRDIMGKTGKAIIEAIINGERESKNFLPLIDGRIQATEEEIEKSLEGNWRSECLFLVKQCYKQYQQLQVHISECAKEIEVVLQQMGALKMEGVIESIEEKGSDDIGNPGKSKEQGQTVKKKSKNAPAYDVRKYLKQIYGVDVLEIFGISETTALEILSETGTDLNRWPTANHFVSWLNLCPNNKITGGKLVSSKIMKKLPNNAAQAFRAAANGVRRSENWMGDYFRRMRAKGGHKFAITATARKLALIFYNMVRNKEAFKPVDIDIYKEKQRQSKIQYLEKRLSELRNASQTAAA